MVSSFGNFPKIKNQRIIDLYWRDEIISFQTFGQTILPHGQGRSYGDSCLNENGILISTQHLNRFIIFDTNKGILECEAGITLSEILELIVPHGWFLPVLPGTKFVSVGGAIANDIHGKNHHLAGTFGNHVLNFQLLRSDGEKYICSSHENPELFHTTIGGLGLTGLILSATLQLKPFTSTLLETEYIKFKNLEEFFTISQQSENHFEYIVAWLDCVSGEKNLGRGIFMRANTFYRERVEDRKPKKKPRLAIPFYFPSFTLNHYSIKAFNNFYYHNKSKKIGIQLVPYEAFFFPLDSIQNWNRIYGKNGFLQYQCVIPHKYVSHIKEILKAIVANGHGSFLSVLKTFGDRSSKGMLSFPIKGVTLALDFSYRGEETLTLLNRLDDIVMACGGRVYPAKDARMSASAFKTFFPNWDEFSNWIDPKFSSSFWRRVTNNET